jgi:cytochrome c peroxidase
MGFKGILSFLLFFSYVANAELFVPLPAKPPVPKDNPMTAGKIELGKKLFFDSRLSVDGTVSCNSCHNVMSSGTDNRRFSAGVGGKNGIAIPQLFELGFLDRAILGWPRTFLGSAVQGASYQSS